MIVIIKNKHGRKKNKQRFLKAVTMAFLLLSAMSFDLPKEFFDPHLGVDYDIFCQLSSYINTDLKELTPRIFSDYEVHIKVLNDLTIQLASLLQRLINFIRPPPASFHPVFHAYFPSF